MRPLKSIRWLLEDWHRLTAIERLLLALLLSLLAHAVLFKLPMPAGTFLFNGPFKIDQSLQLQLQRLPQPSAALASLTEQDAPWLQLVNSAENNRFVDDRTPCTVAPCQAISPPPGLDIYYSASELDQLAQPDHPIILPDLPSVEGKPVSVMLKVYINEHGSVDGVEVLDAIPADYIANISSQFKHAHFIPATKDGRPVKSFKLIQVTSEPSLSVR